MPAYYLEALTIFLGLALLLAEALVDSKNKVWVGVSAAIGLFIILGLTCIAIGPEAKPSAAWASWPLWNFYQFDSLARFYKIFSLIATILVIFLAIDYRKILVHFSSSDASENGTGEFYSLPIFACAGMMFLASAKDLAGAFVALELVTITFYILVGYMRRNVASLEAGVKYLILGALSTGFLVYGIAWIYGATGTMNLSVISQMISENAFQSRALLFGIALVMVGLGFKIGAVPMQMWIPDVYQGAPTPTTAFLSVGSKAAGFILTIRFLEPFLSATATRSSVLSLLLILAIATLLFGNLAAIPQTNFKRLLAYSSIAHAGFLLLALAAGAPESTSLSSAQIVSFYLATYLLMTLGAFFVLSQIRIQRGDEKISDFNGLGTTNPLLALTLTVLLAALAGVPLTAGFWGKFFVFQAAANAQLWTGIAIAAIGAAAGFYYYFNVIRAMWWTAPGNAAPITLPCFTKACLALLTIATLVFGIYPQPILALIK